MRCPAGHPVEDGSRFCATCGAVVRCPNGHALPASAAFCPECGTAAGPRAPAVGAQPVPPVPVSPARRAPAAPVRRRSRARVAVIALAGVVVIGLVLGVVGAINNRDEPLAGDEQPDTDDVPVPTAYDLCVDEFITVTGYLLDNRFSEPALDEVLYEYGSQSDEFDTVMSWVRELAPMQAQQGNDAADERSWELVADHCEAVT